MWSIITSREGCGCEDLRVRYSMVRGAVHDSRLHGYIDEELRQMLSNYLSKGVFCAPATGLVEARDP